MFIMRTNSIIINFIQLIVIFSRTTDADLCQVPFLPALQIVNMPENTVNGSRVANLSITGSPTEISTRLVYNNTNVRTNGTEYFTLNFTELSLRYELDYEWWTSNNFANPFRFVVECTILSTMSSVLIDFQLDLLDVNDNPPTFNKSIYQFNVSELTPINTIISNEITAFDIDSTQFSSFIYFLSPNSSFFRLASPTNASLILTKSLFYNASLTNFNLTIVAQNTDSSALFSRATILISIIDEDNSNPQFSSTSYRLNISIDTSINTEVTPIEGRIYAFDQDIGINATITYSFLTPNNFFTINSTTGQLFVQNLFDSTMQTELIIKAEQVNNSNRTATVTLFVTIFEINDYRPFFLNTPFVLNGFLSSDSSENPLLNGSVNDNDVTPRLRYSSSCNSSSLTLNIRKLSLRDFQIQPILTSNSALATSFFCLLNVSDGKFSNQTSISLVLYQSATFSLNSSLIFVEYSSNNSPVNIAVLRIDSDSRCSTQFFLDASSSNVFSIGSNGNLTWRNPSVGPTQGAYEIQVVLQQSCSSTLIRSVSTRIIVTFRNFPSSTTVASTTRSSGIDNSTIYAIIGGVAAFILIVIAILFIVLYYHIQRAKHRVPPFFKTSKSSSPKFLTFRKSKNLISSSSPLDVRDDDSSNSSSSDQTTSSPIQSRLLSQRYKVTDPPINTTIEELLSSYDNRSTSSSSSSSGPPGQIPISNHPGALRSPLRDSHQLDTINEDRPWMSNDPRIFPLPRMIIPSEDAMDIISESHESSVCGSAIEMGTSASALNQQQMSNKRNGHERTANEYLTVLV